MIRTTIAALVAVVSIATGWTAGQAPSSVRLKYLGTAGWEISGGSQGRVAQNDGHRAGVLHADRRALIVFKRLGATVQEEFGCGACNRRYLQLWSGAL
jgi:hypothetical protein